MKRVQRKRMFLVVLFLTVFLGGLKNLALAQGVDIVDTAVAAGNFKTLVNLIKVAGLNQILKDDQSAYTLFAPTDDAFAKLPAGTLDNLLKPENTMKLQAVLLYHVVPKKIVSVDVAKSKELKTSEGEMLTVTTKDGVTMVNGAKISKADILCLNGVIHQIDAVLMPKQ